MLFSVNILLDFIWGIIVKGDFLNYTLAFINATSVERSFTHRKMRPAKAHSPAVFSTFLGLCDVPAV